MNAPRLGCPINLTLEALGDRWSLIVIRDLMFGNRRHFRELLTRSEERIASNILADRLTRLEKAGLVSRRDDPSHKQKVIFQRRRGVGVFRLPSWAERSCCLVRRECRRAGATEVQNPRLNTPLRGFPDEPIAEIVQRGEPPPKQLSLNHLQCQPIAL